MHMNMEEAKKLFGGIMNENEKVFYAEIPRCVILDKDLSLGAFKLYCYMTARCSGKAKVTWISQKMIAEDLGVTKKTALLNLKILESKNLIEVKRVRDGFIQFNVYMIRDILKVYPKDAKKPWPKREFKAPVVTKRLPPEVTADTPPEVTADTPPEVTADTPKEAECKNAECKNQNEETESPTLPPVVPFADAQGVDLSPAIMPLEIDYEDSHESRLAKKWIADCFERSNRKKMDKSWTLEAAMKALRKEVKWVRAEIKGRDNFDLNDLEMAIDFINRDDILRQNIKSPFKLADKWKNGRVMEVILNNMENHKDNKTMTALRKISEQSQDYDPNDFDLTKMF